VFKEFKAFALKGNVIDLAVAVIIGVAFGKIISSVVEDILMPLIGLLLGRISFTNLQVTVGKTVFAYGNFIQNVVDFIIIAAVLFMIIHAINAAKKKEEATPTPPAPSKEEELLTEIRDLLKAKI
jgi:large conductance mechanosensitive channel